MLTLFFVFFLSEDQKSSASGAKSSTDMSDTLPADVCVRMVGRRVREILDLLARSDNDLECADAYWLQKLLKSVIRALDDLRRACCRPRQVNISISSLVHFIHYITFRLRQQQLYKRPIKIKIDLPHTGSRIMQSNSIRVSKLCRVLYRYR